MIFEYFVFITVYIQNVFSGVHPLATSLGQYHSCTLSQLTGLYTAHYVQSYYGTTH